MEELLQVIIYADTRSEMNYKFYVESLNLLLVLFSGQMMLAPNAKEDTLFIRLLLDNLR